MTRDRVDELIDGGATAAAVQAMAVLFAAAPTAGHAAFVVSRFERLAPALKLTPLRIAILRSFTIEPLVPQLRARCFLAGVDATVHVAGFNQISQEILDPASGLHAFAPDVVIIAALTRDLAPDLWTGDGDRAAATADASARWESWIAGYRRHHAATVIVHTLDQPLLPADGVLDVLAPHAQARAIAAANDSLARIAAGHRGVFVLDYDALVARHGRRAWSDPQKDLAMRVPLTANAFGWLADEYLRYLLPISGRICKAIAVDLDHTLWGGIIGEDGPSGIQLGVEYPGSAFQAMQRALKTLARRGILLAVCSKNNHDDAMAVLRDHPDMLLRPADFAAFRINWDDKAANLQSLARELNIGLDAMAFVDDNPVERDWVRSQAPAVHVVDLPADPVRYAETLLSVPQFERLSLSDEDRAKAEQYRAQRERASAETSAGSVEGFLRSLNMRAAIAGLTPANLPRVAQLTQKTNQFNVATRRYSEEQLAQWAAQPGAIVRAIRVADRYGDNGLVGVVMARVTGTECLIDNLLLSCRVIGRQVETVLLSDVVAQATAQGATMLRGVFRPTDKNAPSRDVFSGHGFAPVGSTAGEESWQLDLAEQAIAAPDWIEVTTE